jgi:hypothetical protein
VAVVVIGIPFEGKVGTPKRGRDARGVPWVCRNPVGKVERESRGFEEARSVAVEEQPQRLGERLSGRTGILGNRHSV